MLLALASTQVIEAVSVANIALPPFGAECVGMLNYRSGEKALVLPVCDACKLIAQSPIAEPAKAVSVIVCKGDQFVTLLVDRLIDVIESDQLEAPPSGANADTPWISDVIYDQQPLSEPVLPWTSMRWNWDGSRIRWSCWLDDALRH